MSNFLKFTILLFLSVRSLAQVPTATINSVSQKFCTGILTEFTALTDTAVDTYSWTIFPSSGATLSAQPGGAAVSILFGRPGNYTVALTVSTGSLSSNAVKTVNVSKSANAAFNASLTGTGYPNDLVLTNYSSDSYVHYWIFSDLGDPDTAYNTTRTYSASGSYTVSLLAIGKNGCDHVSTYSFRLADSSGITLPNVFTPNGDNINDIYRPLARGIRSLNAKVFNRHGVLMHEWSRVNGSWDGHTIAGEACPSDVYFIIVEATGFDGKEYSLKQHITLLR